MVGSVFLFLLSAVVFCTSFPVVSVSAAWWVPSDFPRLQDPQARPNKTAFNKTAVKLYLACSLFDSEKELLFIIETKLVRVRST